MSRFNLFLLCCLVIQAVLLLFLGFPFTRKTSGIIKESEIFKGIPWDSLDRMEIKDNLGKMVTLQVKDGRWVVESLNDYPVKEEGVQQVTGKLKDLRSDRIIVNNPANHASLEVLEGKAQREVKLFGPGKKLLAHFFLGKMINFRNSTLRKAGENEVYGLKEGLNYPLSTYPSNWIETQAVSFKPEDAQEIIFKHGGKAIRIEKNDEGEWWLKEPEEFKAKKDEVNRLIQAFSTLRFSEPLGLEEKPEYGLDEPSAEIEARLKDGSTPKAVFGSKLEGENKVPGKVNGNDFILSFFSYFPESTLKKDLEDFKEKPKKELEIEVPSSPEKEEAPPGEKKAGEGG